MRKFIYTILDILLVLGAITAVLTIDGGRWISVVLNYSQPYQADWDEYTLMQESIVSARSADSEIIPQTGSTIETNPTAASAGDSHLGAQPDCKTIVLPSGPDWVSTDQLLASYQGDWNIQYAPGSLMDTCK